MNLEHFLHVDLVLFVWHCRHVVRLSEVRHIPLSTSSPELLGIMPRDTSVAEALQSSSPREMRKSRRRFRVIPESEQMTKVFNATMSIRLKKTANGQRRVADFVEYPRSISSAVSTPPLVEL